MLNINRYRLRASSCPNIYRNSMTTIAKEKHEVPITNNTIIYNVYCLGTSLIFYLK